MFIYERLIRPTLLVDEARARRNIREMTERARASGVRFRPHFKTHQSTGVGEWFREAGVTAITVSSVAMAEYFAAGGWSDILIASPINVRETAALDRLAEQVTLHLTVDSAEAAKRLTEALRQPVWVWLELNTGDDRTGIEPTERQRIEAIARRIVESDRHRLAGLITHDGQTYTAGAISRISEIFEQTASRLAEIRVWLEMQVGVPLELSIGDTPTGKLVDDLSRVDEIRPGNFVFGDLTQLRIGSCREEELAVALAAPVVSKNETRREIVLQGGAVRLSTDSIQDENGESIYGRIVRLVDGGWSAMVPGCHVSRLSQELSIVRASDELFSSVEVGDLLGVLPVHSCLAIDAMKFLRTLDGGQLGCFREVS